jgi:hypothetical protein
MPSELVRLTVVEWTTEAQNLVKADDPAEIRRLETMLECTQEEAVNHFIEETCWRLDMPEFCDGRGTPEERLAALRALWGAAESEESADA